MSRRLSARQQQNNARRAAENINIKPELEAPAAPENFIGVKAFYTQEQRVKSFTIAPTRKRQSNAKKGAKFASKWSWPADHPAPELMARAGFYFKPAAGEEDNVACFICQKNMSEWDPEDDPAEQHLRHNSSCGWALTMCRDLVLDGKITTDPLRDDMCRARRMTFDHWWPHESKQNWKPSVENVVMAGFIFRPQRDGDDTVYCPYCSLSIDAWEDNDDPRGEHESLGSGDCAFLRHITENPGVAVKGGDRITVHSKSIEDTANHTHTKRRASRARKLATAQRKKAPAKSEAKSEPANSELPDGGDSDNGGALEGSRNPPRGEKRRSSVMEEGSKRQLFTATDDKTAKIFIQNEETSQSRPVKRRVTRASMANQNLNLGPVNTLSQSTPTNGDEASSESVNAGPIKTKQKEKKKATGTSTKSGKGKKTSSSKSPAVAVTDVNDLSRNENKNKGPAVLDVDTKSIEVNIGHQQQNEQEDEQEAIQAAAIPSGLMEKNTRRLTRTKPAYRASHTSESTQTVKKADQQSSSQLPKPNHTESKISNISKRGLAVSTSETFLEVAEGGSENESSHNAPIEKEPNPMTSGESADEYPHISCTLKADQAAVTTNIPDPHVPHSETSPAKPLIERESKTKSVELTEVKALSGTTAKVTKYDQPHKECSTPPVVAESTSISPNKDNDRDRDMKRKSDVVTDDIGDRRSSKKRKTLRAVRPAKTRTTPKASEINGPSPNEVIQRPQVSKPHTTIITMPESSSPSKQAAMEKETLSAIKRSNPSSDVLERLPREKRILDNANESHDSVPEYSEPAVATGATPIKTLQDAIFLSRSDSPSNDCGSQESIPNTQFSVPASQMTVATSFQSFSKGMSFMTLAAEQSPAEQEGCLVRDARENSIVVSPKPTRTPLAVISRSQNGELMSMTPRNRLDEVSFAPVSSQKAWKSVDIDGYIARTKENTKLESSFRGLSESERDMTVVEWIMEVSKGAEKQLVCKGEVLVGFFEDEAERAVSAIEAIETE